MGAGKGNGPMAMDARLQELLVQVQAGLGAAVRKGPVREGGVDVCVCVCVCACVWWLKETWV